MQPIRVAQIIFGIFLLVSPISLYASMQHYLFPNKSTSCADEIPQALSTFVQGYDAWGDVSEYSIISNATGKSLSVFNERSVAEDDESEAAWIEIEKLKKTLLDFQSGLVSRNDWHNLVKYDARKTRHDSLFSATLRNPQDDKLQAEYAALDAELYEEDRHPDALFPPDRGYLSKQKLQRDIQQSLEMLASFEKAGASKVRIVFM